MGEDIDVVKLSDIVTKLTLLFSRVQKFKRTPLYSKHLSHWSLLVDTKKGYKIVLSPHENSLVRVIFLPNGVKESMVDGKKHLIVPFRDYIVGDSYEMFGKTTVAEYVKRMYELNARKEYDIVNYNCQYVVAETMMTFDKMLYVPYMLGSKLLKRSAREMLKKESRFH